MKKWIQSNWSSGRTGRRQVILAGTICLSLAGASGYAARMTLRAPLRYVITMEGEDPRGHYFTTMAVASPNPWQARPMALAAAQEHGFRILGIQEMEVRGTVPRSSRLGVLRAPREKVYFEAECKHHHGECEHEHEAECQHGRH